MKIKGAVPIVGTGPFFLAKQTLLISKEMKWTRDPFDRIITAQADFHESSLLTRDTIITENYSRSCW
ncbi:MAG: hypothetical protein PQJ58_16670 [Spirochaetales bacterium]|nr:hypothetical protein [Spirochaetales bacterium]